MPMIKDDFGSATNSIAEAAIVGFALATMLAVTCMGRSIGKGVGSGCFGRIRCVHPKRTSATAGRRPLRPLISDALTLVDCRPVPHIAKSAYVEVPAMSDVLR